VTQCSRQRVNTASARLVTPRRSKVKHRSSSRAVAAVSDMRRCCSADLHARPKPAATLPGDRIQRDPTPRWMLRIGERDSVRLRKALATALPPLKLPEILAAGIDNVPRVVLSPGRCRITAGTPGSTHTAGPRSCDSHQLPGRGARGVALPQIRLQLALNVKPLGQHSSERAASWAWRAQHGGPKGFASSAGGEANPPVWPDKNAETLGTGQENSRVSCGKQQQPRDTKETKTSTHTRSDRIQHRMLHARFRPNATYSI